MTHLLLDIANHDRMPPDYTAEASTVNTLEQLRARYSRMANDDVDEDEGDISDGSNTVLGDGVSFELCHIFDTKSPYWRSYRPSMAIGSLNDELQAFDLEELDAEGEDEMDYDVSLNSLLDNIC
jgi:hypothetical protein